LTGLKNVYGTSLTAVLSRDIALSTETYQYLCEQKNKIASQYFTTMMISGATVASPHP
jgi:hypothetical protein